MGRSMPGIVDRIYKAAIGENSDIELGKRQTSRVRLAVAGVKLKRNWIPRKRFLAESELTIGG